MVGTRACFVMRKVDLIVVHHNGRAGRTIDDVRRTHVDGFGWSDVGYHFVVHEDGSVHAGRPVELVGAHTKGLNSHSVGVCLIGNGSIRPFKPEQLAALQAVLRTLMACYRVPASRVIGHREAERFGGTPTRKLCPGAHLSMEWLRGTLA